MSASPALPNVSLCTPTADRHAFLPLLSECIRRQSYPDERMEWIILDDGRSPAKDVVASCVPGNTDVRYVRSEARMALGDKRNRLNALATGDIIVYLDDDDFYPSSRVAHAVESLLAHPERQVAGASCLHVWLPDDDEIWRIGPFGPSHATAATLAFRRALLDVAAFDASACAAEERSFLKNFSLPMVQLDSMKTILALSHGANTVDKRRILDAGPSSTVWRLSLRPEEIVDRDLLVAYRNAARARGHLQIK